MHSHCKSHRSYRAWHSVRTVAADPFGSIVLERDDEPIAMEFYKFVALSLDSSEPQRGGLDGVRYIGCVDIRRSGRPELVTYRGIVQNAALGDCHPATCLVLGHRWTKFQFVKVL